MAARIRHSARGLSELILGLSSGLRSKQRWPITAFSQAKPSRHFAIMFGYEMVPFYLIEILLAYALLLHGSSHGSYYRFSAIPPPGARAHTPTHTQTHTPRLHNARAHDARRARTHMHGSEEK